MAECSGASSQALYSSPANHLAAAPISVEGALGPIHPRPVIDEWTHSRAALVAPILQPPIRAAVSRQMNVR